MPSSVVALTTPVRRCRYLLRLVPKRERLLSLRLQTRRARPPNMTTTPRLLLLLALAALLLCSARPARAHNEGAPASPCQGDLGVTVEAEFRPGIITVDGNSDDWTDVDGRQFPLLPALNPDPALRFPMDPGSLQIKAVHDGRDVFFHLEVNGDYAFLEGSPRSCPAVSLMFGVGDDATYYNMGGCRQSPGNCSHSNCHGHEVDIMRFFLSSAIPGRLYGSNFLDNFKGTGADRFGNLNDLYGWSPHCTHLDGTGPDVPEESGAQNDWKGAWTHSSISLEYGLLKSDSPYSVTGTKGAYIFEFARPLRTNDRLQQDVQFRIGGTIPFAAAVWYPVDGKDWHDSAHYSANCEWIPLKLAPARSGGMSSTGAVKVIATMAIMVALGALGTSLALGWWVKSSNPRPGFQGVPNL